MIEPKTYRKKPVHVKAIRYTGNNGADIGLFVGAADRNEDNQFLIHTLEGKMAADPGDYIIRGVAGEFYPCKPDIFAATYEQVDQGGNRVNSTQYPENPKTAMMTVAAVLEWLEGEEEDLESDRKKIKNKYPKQIAKKIDEQLGASITTIETLIEKMTKSTFEQMDEAYGNE